MNSKDTPQLVLPLFARVQQNWDNFVVGENQLLVNAVEASVSEALTEQYPAVSLIFLAGSHGAGKSHLLFALLGNLINSGHSNQVQYLDLEQEGRDHLGLADIAPKKINLLDNVDVLAGDSNSERALFGVVEQIRQKQCTYIVTARSTLNEAAFELKDLASRLGAGLQFNVSEMDDQQTQRAIAMRFKSMGLHVTEAVTSYILTRFPRDKHKLFAALDALDAAALKEQRKITIPFIRDTVLGN